VTVNARERADQESDFSRDANKWWDSVQRAAFDTTLDVAGKVWNLPNTAVGLLYGGFSLAVDKVAGINGMKVGLGNNAIEFINNPITNWLGGGAITLGNTINYDHYGPAVYGDHERQHTYQGQMLGPVYLPANIIGLSLGQLMGDHHGPYSFMEIGPEGLYSNGIPVPFPGMRPR